MCYRHIHTLHAPARAALQQALTSPEDSQPKPGTTANPAPRHPLTWTRCKIALHTLAGTLGAPQDPAVCPRICTSIQHRNNPNLVWRPGAPAKIAFLVDWAEENSSLPLLSPPHPPKTPANIFCPPPSLPSPCKANFQQPQMQLLGSKLPPVLEVRAVTLPGLCLSCWDGVCCFTESLLRLLNTAAHSSGHCASLPGDLDRDTPGSLLSPPLSARGRANSDQLLRCFDSFKWGLSYSSGLEKHCQLLNKKSISPSMGKV